MKKNMKEITKKSHRYDFLYKTREKYCLMLHKLIKKFYAKRKKLIIIFLVFLYFFFWFSSTCLLYNFQDYIYYTLYTFIFMNISSAHPANGNFLIETVINLFIEIFCVWHTNIHTYFEMYVYKHITMIFT